MFSFEIYTVFNDMRMKTYIQPYNIEDYDSPYKDSYMPPRGVGKVKKQGEKKSKKRSHQNSDHHSYPDRTILINNREKTWRVGSIA